MTEQNRDLVLVTGASGFVGSSVARIAQQKGFNVRVLVRATAAKDAGASAAPVSGEAPLLIGSAPVMQPAFAAIADASSRFFASIK